MYVMGSEGKERIFFDHSVLYLLYHSVVVVGVVYSREKFSYHIIHSISSS